MNHLKYYTILPLILLSSLILLLPSCSGVKKVQLQASIAPNIDLSHWKVTIPTPRPDGRPMEFSPPEILNYPAIAALKEFMYPDSTDGSIVFNTYPLASTANSKYSRSELREQMEPGNNSVNWKFTDGGYMKVRMSVPEVTKDKKGKGHRVIIAQIHGKLTKEQQAQIGQKDTNAPPILKVYYQDGKVEVKTKVLKIKNPTEDEILMTENWVDAEKYIFGSLVNQRKFTLEVIVSDGRLEVVLNGYDRAVYKNKSIQQWGIFDNYFKVGNYLNTRDEGANAKVKIYELEVRH